MDNIQKALDAFEKMDDSQRHATLLMLLTNGTINMTKAISAYGSYLEKFKEDAMHDIGRLGTAGLDLAEKQIKQIPKMKNDRARHVAIAQATTLLSTRCYEGTPFEKKLKDSIDVNEIDQDWFEQSWGLRTVSRENKEE